MKDPISARKLTRLFEPLKDEVMKVNLIILAELYIHKLELNAVAFISMSVLVVIIIIFSGVRLLKGDK